MVAWVKRFGLHLAAAVGATSIFVVSAAAGASQTRQQEAALAGPSPMASVVRTPPVGQRRPGVVAASPSPSGTPTPRQPRPAVRPERSLAGTIQDVQADAIEILGVGGRTWRVEPAPGALIRLNGKAAKLDALEVGDGVVILGQAEPGPGARFLAHAITARTR